MTEPRRRRNTGWTEPDTPDPDDTADDAQAPDPGLDMVTFATVFNDRLIIPVTGQDEPLTITTAGTRVPAELADLVRTAAADSRVPIRETR